MKYLDLFSGAGGFRAAFEQIPGTKCVGHCEIEPHANKSYRALFYTEGEWFCNDARQINTDEMSDFDLVCGGFPCQSFSIAGHRKGFEDTRGTLFFEIARILGAKKPPFVLLENVPGLLSHDQGRTFRVILGTLSDLGYHVEWQVLNSKDHGVPQSRQRVFIVGYLGAGCTGKILPILGTNRKALVSVLRGKQGYCVYDPTGTSCTLTAGTGGLGGRTGLYDMGKAASESTDVLLIKEATRKGYKEASVGDSVDLSYATSNTRRGRVGKDIAHTLDTGSTQGVVTLSGRIRRLTPRECFRLQGYKEEQIDKILAVTSDSQAYKQAGNGVTVNVVYAIGLRIKAVWDELYSENAGEASC